jgi:hypothetical protein
VTERTTTINRTLRSLALGLTGAAVAALAVFSGGATPAHADSYVDGYYRSNGTYVSPHYRSSPNSSTTDNWSYSGNYNPYTGARGTQSYDPSYPSYAPGYSSGYSGYSSSRSRSTYSPYSSWR